MKIELNVDPNDFICAQLIIVTSIIVLGVLCYIIPLVTGHRELLGFLRLIDVGEEKSLPTYFSTLNLLLSSFLIFIIYRIEKSINRKGSNYWLFLAIGFFYLSFDEAVCIHENFNRVHNYFEHLGIISPLFATNKWLVFGVLFTVIIGIMFFPFIKSLPNHLKIGFIVCGFVFLLGAIGFEFVGTLMVDTGFVEKSDFIYKLRRILEEGCEMYGIAFFNCVLYREIFNKKITLILNNYQAVHKRIQKPIPPIKHRFPEDIPDNRVSIHQEYR